jgi:glycosyltransferase involved in cell wall biosynthesis
LKTILFVSKNLTSSSTRYRATDFFPHFERSAWQPLHFTDNQSITSRLQLLSMARKADTVVVVRRTFGYLYASLLRRSTKKLIFTFDDAIFSKSDGSRSAGRERRFSQTIPLCDHIWAGNSYLAEKALQHNKNVTIIPTTLDIHKYNIQAQKPASTLDLVWIGSSSTKKHLLTVLPALEAAAASVPSLRLKVISDFSLESTRLNIVTIPWSADTEAQELASAHIGIAPLPDNAYTRGKCGLKVLQYMAAGLPVISSPTGANRDIVQHNNTGIIAGSRQEWVNAITKLAHSPELRSQMGAAGRKRCAEHFTLDAAFKKMLSTTSRQP